MAGMLIGPHGLQLIKGVHEIEMMAEIGVIFLLFTIGLEVSLTQLLRIKKMIFLIGGAQVILTTGVAFLVFRMMDFEINIAFLWGMLISLSSTAIVMKILSDRDELSTPQGKISVGTLIFQDLVVVPMFLILPMLKSDANLSFGYLLEKIGLAFGLLIAILFVSKFFMPKIMYQLAKLRMRDGFLIGVLTIILGTAYLTHSLGLSFALGAFIAGLILAESEYNTQILSDIIPFKDVFNSIFFVSVGLLLNVNFVFEFPLLISEMTIGVILIKMTIIILLILSMRYPFRIALITSLGLAQVGEFSFILAQAAGNYNLFDETSYNVFLSSSIFTMIITPFLFMLSSHLGFATQQIPSFKKNKKNEKLRSLTNHVIIAGFGLNGRNLARVLRETGINYVVVEMNPDTVRNEKAKGENIIYGDISKVEVLKHANAASANMLVFSISDLPTTERAVKTVKMLNPKIYVLVRTRYVSEIDRLKTFGADSVIPEEFETSLEIFRNVLLKYHVPINVIMKQISLLRGESYKLLWGENMSASSLSHLDEILAENLTETYFVNEDNPNINVSIKEINLKARTGTTIITIIRNEKTIFNPSGNEKLQPHDTLVITGAHKAIDDAINILNGE